jgi:hypothetical protein
MARTFILGTYIPKGSAIGHALKICAKPCVFSENPIQNPFHLESLLVKFGAQGVVVL